MRKLFLLIFFSLFFSFFVQKTLVLAENVPIWNPPNGNCMSQSFPNVRLEISGSNTTGPFAAKIYWTDLSDDQFKSITNRYPYLIGVDLEGSTPLNRHDADSIIPEAKIAQQINIPNPTNANGSDLTLDVYLTLDNAGQCTLTNVVRANFKVATAADAPTKGQVCQLNRQNQEGYACKDSVCVSANGSIGICSVKNNITDDCNPAQGNICEDGTYCKKDDGTICYDGQTTSCAGKCKSSDNNFGIGESNAYNATGAKVLCANGIENDKTCDSIDTGLGFAVSTDLPIFLTTIFAVVLSIAGLIALLLIIIAGYRLIVSRGNPEAVQNAREQLMAAIVGLLFVIFSLVILQVIGVNILDIPGFG